MSFIDIVEYEDRFRALDDRDHYSRRAEQYPDIGHYLSVIRLIVDDSQPKPIIDPVAADRLVAGSQLLSRLDSDYSELTCGPVPLDRQLTVLTSPMAGRTGRGLTPDAAKFTDLDSGTVIKAATKPFEVGFFTSTEYAPNHNMWRDYLDMYPRSTLHPRPWRTWRVSPMPDNDIAEVTRAQDWSDLVRAHPMPHDGLLFPDWNSIAEKYDAIHMTVRAIVAMQGLRLSTPDGVIAPTYWDVESTFWLHWRFTSTELVDIAT
ncbi:MAG TPA: hypothetical protein VG317_06985 [Pseudonocardiaceae bacterium]|nr:hypothetical protein [Pseudonocardiaceae bacterium]